MPKPAVYVTFSKMLCLNFLFHNMTSDICVLILKTDTRWGHPSISGVKGQIFISLHWGSKML